MTLNYFKTMCNMEQVCDEFKSATKELFMITTADGSRIFPKINSNPFYCFSPRYMQYIEYLIPSMEVCDKLGIQTLEMEKPLLDSTLIRLQTPQIVQSWEGFEHHLNIIKKIFGETRDELWSVLSILSEDEMSRMNEAIHDLTEGCYYSSIAMSVSALESRLLDLVKTKTNDPKLDNLTLGQLIGRLSENAYANVIPTKHKALVELCNIYRIFSVHPKSESMNKAQASSILGLSLSLLLDRNTKP